ncbi:MAG: Hint domain-containing protein [Cypionkella sp.]|nr:Hint domain-containing protein [Cypionkella sp.]
MAGTAQTEFGSVHQGALPPGAALPFGTRPARQDWLALSDKGLIDPWANPFRDMAMGTFVAELRLPLPRAKVLINLQSNHGVARSFGLFVGPDGGLSLLHRDGMAVQRVTLPAPLAASGDTARLSFRFDAVAKTWAMRLESLDNVAPTSHASGIGSLAFANGDVDDICKKAAVDPAVLWFGFCRSVELPRAAPWIGLRTPIETQKGWIAAAHLKAGDMIVTQDRGPLPLRAVHRVDLPARGSFAPVLLRGPFYDPRGDLLVSADQRIAMTGSAVEYLFGTDAVLVAARDVVDGHTALAEDRRHVISAVSLDLGVSALIGGNGSLGLAMGDFAQSGDAPLMCLNSFETVALMRMMGRVVSRVA